MKMFSFFKNISFVLKQQNKTRFLKNFSESRQDVRDPESG